MCSLYLSNYWSERLSAQLSRLFWLILWSAERPNNCWVASGLKHVCWLTTIWLTTLRLTTIIYKTHYWSIQINNSANEEFSQCTQVCMIQFLSNLALWQKNCDKKNAIKNAIQFDSSVISRDTLGMSFFIIFQSRADMLAYEVSLLVFKMAGGVGDKPVRPWKRFSNINSEVSVAYWTILSFQLVFFSGISS
jgi:hypothetical protein